MSIVPDRPLQRVDVDDVAVIRRMLRRVDPASRHLAMATVREWDPASLDPEVAAALVDAAADIYPALSGEDPEPGLCFAELLLDRPDLAVPDSLLGVFDRCGERVQLVWIAVLALRLDDDALGAIESLLCSGIDHGIPRPRAGVLHPLIDHHDRGRVIDLALTLLRLADWRRTATELLVDLAVSAPIPPDRHDRLMAETQRQALELIDLCDRATLDGEAPKRRERAVLEQLVGVVDLVAEVDAPAPTLWWRLLSSADPQLGAIGAIRLVRSGEQVGADRLLLIARDPVARVALHDGLAGLAAAFSPAEMETLAGSIDYVAIAEGRLVAWLAALMELGRAPDEMEFVTTLWHDLEGNVTEQGCTSCDDGVVAGAPAGDDPEQEPLYVFRFRLRAPHWSSARDWMIGVSSTSLTGSTYLPEDGADLATHVREICDALTDWPDTDDRADGEGSER